MLSCLDSIKMLMSKVDQSLAVLSEGPPGNSGNLSLVCSIVNGKHLQ